MKADPVYVVTADAPHIAAQHAAMVRALLARRQPALSAALGKAARDA